MAQLILSAAGAAISTYMGFGPAAGWAIGSMLGAATIKNPTQKVQGDQQTLMDLRITGTEYGQTIPFLIGSASIAGQMWWNTDRRPNTVTTTTHTGGGGKGGGGGGTDVTSSSTTYEMDCLIGLTDNPIIGIARVWINGALIWTSDHDATDASRAASLVSTSWKRLTVYNGSDTQLPDPTYEAAVGIGNAPAYRGRSYVFIEGLKLGQGGQVPNVTFEVVAAGHALVAGTFASYDSARTAPGSGLNVSSNMLWNDIGYGMASMAYSMSIADQSRTVGAGGGSWFCEFHLYGNESGCGLANMDCHPVEGMMLGSDANSIGIAPSWGSGYFFGVHLYKFGDAPLSIPCDGYGQGIWGMEFDAVAGSIHLWQNNVDKGVVATGLTGSWAPAGQVMGRWGGANAGFNSGVTSFTYPAHGSPWVTGASDIITKTPPTLQSAVETLCIRAGLLSGQFDASPLSSITRKVNSLPVSQIAATRVALDLLMSAFYFEMVVSDKIYFRPRGSAPVANIAFTDLAASASDSKEEPLPLLQASDLEIPAQIALTYVNITDDYQPDTQYSDRLITATAQTVTTVQMTLGMTPQEAKAVADTMLADQAATVISTNLRVLGDYCRLEPTDVVNVAGPNGESFRVRLVKKTDSYPVLQFDAVVDDASVLVSPGVTSVDYISSTEVLFPAVTWMELLDIPILAETDNDAGFYVVAKGDASNWQGAGIFQSTDDVEFARVATILESATFGACTSILGDFTGGRIFDEINSVTVDMGALGILTSTTRDALLNGAGLNAMMIGAEFIQYRTARLISAGIYRLSGLLRGGRGTEWAIAGHVAAERCVALSSTGMKRIAIPNSDIGLTRHYKGVTLGGALSSATSRPFIDTAVGLKPFSPVLVNAARAPGNTIILDWQRRSRTAVRMIGAAGISVPLTETSEKYAVDIYDESFSTLLGTVETTSPSLMISGGTIPVPGTGSLAVETTAASVAMQSFSGINRDWPFYKQGNQWVAPNGGNGLGATVIDADGTIHDSVVDFALCYALSNHIDPFGMRTTPATGWAMLADGSPISSTISDRDAYYTMARDHRATAGNIVTTSGRGMRLVFSGPGTSMHALSKTETGFTVIDKSTIGGTLGVARYPIQEYFSGSRASLNSPSTFDTFTWGSQVSSVSGEYPLDAIVFGSLIYTHTLGPTDLFNSATVAVDVTNLITAHVDIANAEEYQTVRHTIDSGGVITALDVRSGMFLADRINDTQAAEIDVAAHQFSLVDVATGALSSPIALPGGSTIVAVAGDYGVGNIFYTIDSASVIRKHDSTGALLATIDTGFLAIYPPSFMLSADHLFVQRQSVLLQWAGWYVLDKDLTGVGLISRSVIGQTGPGGFQAVNDNNPVPFSATPDTAEIVALLPNMTNALATMGSVSTVPAIAGVRISQISETVGKGYPLELVI